MRRRFNFGACDHEYWRASAAEISSGRRLADNSGVQSGDAAVDIGENREGIDRFEVKKISPEIVGGATGGVAGDHREHLRSQARGQLACLGDQSGAVPLAEPQIGQEAGCRDAPIESGDDSGSRTADEHAPALCAKEFADLVREFDFVVPVGESGDTYDQLKGVTIYGRARIIEDLDEVFAFGDDVFERYWGPIDSDATREGVRAMGRKRVMILVERDKTVSWDHTKLGGRY